MFERRPAQGNLSRASGLFGQSIALAAVLVAVLSWSPALAAEFAVKQTDDGVTVRLGDEVLTEYRTKSGNKPIVAPLRAPGGQLLSRAYPLETVKGETHDHPHHRSLWFTHGDVNGVDFWLDEGSKAGTVVHRKFNRVEATKASSVIEAENDWLAPGGKRLLTDRRRLTFSANDAARTIDFDIRLTASDGDVTFGDTKEGTFGVRVADSLRVEAKSGGKIVNSAGETDDKAWGRPADWVDYHGPVAGETVGIAILNHPSSFGYPTRWHVRGYGLFAANPFGAKSFGGDKSGAYKLTAGKSITLCYRVLLHAGDEKAAQVAEAFAEYAKTKPAE